MAVIAIADIEIRGVVEWAVEDLGATPPEVLSGIFYTLFVIFILMYVNVCACIKWSWAVV